MCKPLTNGCPDVRTGPDGGALDQRALGLFLQKFQLR
jgi:hypothetical protein